MSSPEYTPYKDALTSSMTFLGQQKDTVFIGQQILWHGNPMSTTISDVPKDKLIELPEATSEEGTGVVKYRDSKPAKTFESAW